MATFTKRASAAVAGVKRNGGSKSRAKQSTAEKPPAHAVVLKLATWNVDGLCEDHLGRRSHESARILLATRADVIFLQEVVPASQPIFERVLGRAYALAGGGGNGAPYWTLAFVRRDHRVMQARRDAFTGAGRSMMGRDLLLLDIAVGAPPKHGGGGDAVVVRCVTSHLESTKPMARQRVAQLSQIAGAMHAFGGPAVCGGDFNMRDVEQHEALADRPMTDAYLFFGRPADARATWACPGRPHVTCRFDRVYTAGRRAVFVRNVAIERRKGGDGTGAGGDGEGLGDEGGNGLDGHVPAGINMLGRRKIASIGMTPSDHFGVVVSVKVWNGSGGRSAVGATSSARPSSSSATASSSSPSSSSASRSAGSGTLGAAATAAANTARRDPRAAMREAAIKRDEALRARRRQEKLRRRQAEAGGDAVAAAARAGEGAPPSSAGYSIRDALRDGNAAAVDAQLARARGGGGDGGGGAAATATTAPPRRAVPSDAAPGGGEGRCKRARREAGAAAAISGGSSAASSRSGGGGGGGGGGPDQDAAADSGDEVIDLS